MALPAVTAACDLEQERTKRALESPDPIQRAEALEKLADTGDGDATRLVAPLLRDPSARVRKKAVAALGLLGVQPHLRQVIGRLNDADLEVRLTTVRVLGDSGLKAARPALLLALQDPSMVVRRAAALALESLGMSRPEQIRALAREELDAQIKRLHHPDDQIRANAARMVGLSGQQEGLSALFRLLSHRSPMVVLEASRAIGRIGGDRALTRLGELAGADATRLRSAAATGLGQMARSSSGASKMLGRLLGDPAPAVQRAAADGLARAAHAVVGADLKRACALLASQEDGVARAAARLVRPNGEGACAEVEDLARRAEAGDASTLDVLATLPGRRATVALLALARRGYETYRHGAVKWVAPNRWAELDQGGTPGENKPRPRKPSSDPKRQALERLLAKFPERKQDQEEDPLLPPEVAAAQVVQMIRALAGRAGPESWLAHVATEAPLAVRVAALEALEGSDVGGDVEQAVRLALSSARASVRAAALHACQRLGDGAVESAVRLLLDKDFDVRTEAARCLGRLGDSRALKPLMQALEREHSVAAIRAVARLGDHAATAALLGMLQEDHAETRRDERVVVIEALGRLGDPEAGAALERELSHPAWQVRRAAAAALSGLEGSPSASALAICRNDYHAAVRQACSPPRVGASQPASRPTRPPR
ncbi:MAG: HEAT repeat domain-containing protein [Deltaproteobacteria bacterium]|nr:HEAT repeat domain-containing protein [Deltaproteobacteria bacterium]